MIHNRTVFTIDSWEGLSRKCIAYLMLVLMIAAGFSGVFLTETISVETSAMEEPQARSGTTDSDGDGIPDSEDILDNGDAILVFSMDYIELDGSADFWSEGDPFFIIWIDANGNDEVDTDSGENETWTSSMFEDSDIIDDEGFEDGGVLWHGFDILDNMSSIRMQIIVRDDDNDGDYDNVDISSNANQYWLDLYYEFDQDGPLSDTYSDDGSDDGGEEIDGKIKCSIHLIKGASIDEVTPASFEYSIKEGESITFEIERFSIPQDPIKTENVQYDWLFAFVDDTENWYPLINGSQKFIDHYKLSAHYGSEGKYYIACIMYTMVQDHDCYFWDYRIWELTVIHNNTTPSASIDVNEMTVEQFDEVSFSGKQSTDLDGDKLTYHWDFGDGETAEGMDTTHAYINPGEYDVTLTVTDDENASNSTSITMNVDPLDLSGAVQWYTLEDKGTFTLNTDYLSNARYENTQTVNLPLADGYSLDASVTFISRTTVQHYGNTTFQYSIDETKNAITINTELTEKDDYYIVYYYPSFEFDLSFFDSESGERETLWNTEVPVPIESNFDGLDADGDPLIEIPVFGIGEVSIYTWDKQKKIYESPEPLINHNGSLNLETEPITVMDVDILKFLEAITGIFPTVSFGIEILNYFVNLFLQGNLNIGLVIEDSIGLLTRSSGVLDQEEFLWYTLASPEHRQTISGLNTETKIYGIMNTAVDSSLSASLDFYFNLTGIGQSVYGLWTSMNEKGFITGIFDAFTSFFSTGSLPQEDYSFRKTLWETGELIHMENQQLYYWDYLSCSHVAVNQLPIVTISSPSNNSRVSDLVTIKGTAEDSDDSIVSVEVSIDGSDWDAATGTESWSYQIDASAMITGDHMVRVRSYDSYEYSDIAYLNLKVDDTNSGTPDNNDGDDDFTIAGMDSITVAGGAGALIILLVAVVVMVRSRKKGKKGIGGDAGSEIVGASSSANGVLATQLSTFTQQTHPETIAPHGVQYGPQIQQTLLSQQPSTQTPIMPQAPTVTGPTGMQVPMQQPTMEQQTPLQAPLPATVPALFPTNMPSQNIAPQGSQWKCTNCESEMPGDFRFCTACGTKRVQ